MAKNKKIETISAYFSKLMQSTIENIIWLIPRQSTFKKKNYSILIQRLVVLTL